jgi:hypothetical protein
MNRDTGRSVENEGDDITRMSIVFVFLVLLLGFVYKDKLKCSCVEI